MYIYVYGNEYKKYCIIIRTPVDPRKRDVCRYGVTAVRVQSHLENGKFQTIRVYIISIKKILKKVKNQRQH